MGRPGRFRQEATAASSAASPECTAAARAVIAVAIGPDAVHEVIEAVLAADRKPDGTLSQDKRFIRADKR